MESLKKVAVLLTGLAIVVFVGWLLTISLAKPKDGFQPRKQITAKENTVPENEEPAEITENNRDFESTKEPDKKPITPPALSNNPSEIISRDTISWLKMSDAEKEQSAPVISGKMPFSGNPNPIFTSAASKILPAVVSIQSSRRSALSQT